MCAKRKQFLIMHASISNIGLGLKLIVMTDSALFFISSTDSTADPDPIIGTPLLCIAL